MDNLNDMTPQGIDAAGFDCAAVLAAGDLRDVAGDLAPDTADDAAFAPDTVTRDTTAEHDDQANHSPEYPRDYDSDEGSPGELDEYDPVEMDPEIEEFDRRSAAWHAGRGSGWEDDTAAAEAPEPGPEDPDPQPDDDGPTHAADGMAFKRTPPSRQEIQIQAGRMDLAADEAETALIGAKLPIFQRGAELVRPCAREVPASHNRLTLAAGLTALNVAWLTDKLCAAAEFLRYDKRTEDFRIVEPPLKAVEILLSRSGNWNFPTVSGIVTTPTMRPDGSILSAQGYDEATRLYHAADAGIRLHPAVFNPTRKAAEGALRALSELLSEFPFVGYSPGVGRLECTVSGAVALSAIVTAVTRGAMRVAPLHAFKAHSAGTGKSYLADVVSAIATGRPCPVVSVAPDNNETEKRIASKLLQGSALISLDNVNGELGGDLLCQAVERPIVEIRKFQTQEMAEVENQATFLATGNNLRVRGDMVRRTLVCELDAGVERPELLTKNGRPVDDILADRGRYVSAALVIVAAYIRAGSPGKLKPLASFEGWSNTVRSALVWLDCADPVESMEQAREDDPELAELREVVTLWNDAFGTSTITLRDAVTEAERLITLHDADGEAPPYGDRAPRWPDLAEVLKRVSRGRNGADTRALGVWMRNHEGKPVGRFRFKRDGMTAGTVRWRLVAK